MRTIPYRGDYHPNMGAVVASWRGYVGTFVTNIRDFGIEINYGEVWRGLKRRREVNKERLMRKVLYKSPWYCIGTWEHHIEGFVYWYIFLCY